MTSSPITIRTATPDDAAALLAIYAPYVTKTAITFEYEVPSEEEFRRRIRTTLEAYPYLVAEQGGKIIGYVYASAFHTRPAYDWNVETSIYIAQDARHTGAGRKLYEALETYLRAQGIVTLYACITYPATPDPYVDTNSVDFHSHMGYDLVANFKKSGYKFDRWYDVVWMEKEIGAHRTPMAPVKRFPEICDR